MQSVKYILVNETGCKEPICDARHRDVPRVGHCIVCDTSSKFKVEGSRERQALIDELCRLRRHWPEAPILGVSELDTSSAYAPVRVSPWMNQLRRKMSDLP
ncbi:MAG: hypothetical protein IJ607_11075 [Bacteroidaceae bacterium]|nr:hypothetical protein [Bacteroidaceae bacterium]